MELFNGIGVQARGDLLCIYHGADARVDRTRWIFDQADALAARHKEILCLMIVPETAAPPDSAARTENNMRFAKLQNSLRRMVTVPQGSAFHVSIVRTIMRGTIMLKGHGAFHIIRDTEPAGIDAIMEVAGKLTPPRAQIIGDLDELRRRLSAEQALNAT